MARPLCSLLPLLLLLLLPQTWAFVPYPAATASSFGLSTAARTTTSVQRRAGVALRMAADEQVKTRL